MQESCYRLKILYCKLQRTFSSLNHLAFGDNSQCFGAINVATGYLDNGSFNCICTQINDDDRCQAMADAFSRPASFALHMDSL